MQTIAKGAKNISYYINKPKITYTNVEKCFKTITVVKKNSILQIND